MLNGLVPAQEMHGDHDQRKDKGDVDQAASNVEAKAENPANWENDSDDGEHIFLLLI